MNTETIEQRINRQMELRRVSRHDTKVLRRFKKATSPRRKPFASQRSAAHIRAAARAATRKHLAEKAATVKARRRKR
jgi:hypothetical protein